MLIKDIKLLDRDFKVHEHQNVLVEADRFKYIGSELPEEYAGEVIDGKDKLMMPGFYNTHCHLPMTMIRGRGEGLPLHDWLEQAMFPFENRMKPEDCYYGALLGIMELISSGCVSVSDMYFNIIDIATALHESGMKGNVCHGVTCMDPSKKIEDIKGYRDTLSLMDIVRDWSDDRVRVDAGLHAEYTSTEKLIEKMSGLAKQNGMIFHTHISETRKEHEECKSRRGGRTPVQYMESLGVFENPVMCAHCVWIEDEDKEILARHHATISHCISSNLKLGSGIATVYDFLKRGINTVVATDGASSNNNLNLMEEMHLVSLAAKGFFRDPTMLLPADVLRMATINGARAQGRTDCGVIEEGFRADFVIVDLDRPHLAPLHDPVSNLVHSAQSSDIWMTVVDGRILYKDGEFLTIDKERVIHEAKKRAERIAAELSEAGMK